MKPGYIYALNHSPLTSLSRSTAHKIFINNVFHVFNGSFLAVNVTSGVHCIYPKARYWQVLKEVEKR